MTNNAPILTVYLAGPVSNCNDNQRTRWREAIKAKLRHFGHETKDPTDHGEGWTPLTEMIDIDSSDVVIANLWRESIGTVVGIVQARRKGKPVILIDQNYLDSRILKKLVGEGRVVHSIEKTVNMLQYEILPQISQNVAVQNRGGHSEPFEFSKLHDSLIAVCARVHVQDAVLPELVAHEVHRRLRKAAGAAGEITTDDIKQLVFEQLGEIIKDELYEDRLKSCALKLREGWDEYEKVKKDSRVAMRMLEEYQDKIQRLEKENASLRQQLDFKHTPLGGVAAKPEAMDVNPAINLVRRIKTVLGGRKGLCVRSLEKSAFADVFARHGLKIRDFEEFFEEQPREGKQSNLNSDLRDWIKTHSYVLYAYDGLRHLDHAAPNLISARTANEAVIKFLAKGT